MRRAFAWIVAGAIVGGSLTGVVGAMAQDGAQDGPTRYAAVVVDRGTLTEDDAAHARLAIFERKADGSIRLVFRVPSQHN